MKAGNNFDSRVLVALDFPDSARVMDFVDRISPELCRLKVGKELFTANCAVCHRLEGVGQSIGPELTGIGARPKADLLIEVLDPNRSVEANYRLWTVTTKSGDTLAGRLDAETQTSIDLTDLVGQKHSVARKDIASLESSNQSIMPVGFEALGEDGLAAVLAYLATSNTKP